MQAMAAIREFAGESVAVATDAVNAENVEEFENAAAEYEDVSAYSQKIRAAAEALKISGIATVKNWEFKHPLAGRMVYGVVCTWSPKQAQNARGLSDAMNATTPTPIGGANSDTKPDVDTDGSLINAGADGDEDAI